MSGLSAAPSPLSDRFVSAGLAMVPAGLLVVPHGLSKAPRLIRATLECVTAESGYAVGQVVDINSILPPDTGNSTSNGLAIIADAANITVRVGNSTKLFTLIDAATGAKAQASTANWLLYLEAYA